MKKSKAKLTEKDWCCCGHHRKKHTIYAGGTNRKGSRYVCTADACTMWKDCNLK
jgi:hypothetical protein